MFGMNSRSFSFDFNRQQMFNNQKMHTKQNAWHIAVFQGLLGVTLPVDTSGGIRRPMAEERRFVISDGRKGPSQTETVRKFWPDSTLVVRWFVLPVFADPFCSHEELEHFGKLEVMLVFELVLFGRPTLVKEAEFICLFCVCCWLSSSVNLGRN